MKDEIKKYFFPYLSKEVTAKLEKELDKILKEQAEKKKEKEIKIDELLSHKFEEPSNGSAYIISMI